MNSNKKKPQRAGRLQTTTPKKGEPVEIPVPKRKTFEDMLRRAALRRSSTNK
jgi:hypothetical protein